MLLAGPGLRYVFNDPRVPEFVAASVGSTDCEAYASLGTELDGRIVGGVVYDNFTGPNIFIHFSRGPGHTFRRDFLRLVFGYAFDCLKVKRITGACSEANVRVRRFAERLGFEYETRLAGAYPDGDMVFYRLERSRAKFLVRR